MSVRVNSGRRTADGADEGSRLSSWVVHLVGACGTRRSYQIDSITVRCPPSAIHSPGGRDGS